jgi:uncharacterized protein YyaL (SSP411 family)
MTSKIKLIAIFLMMIAVSSCKKKDAELETKQELIKRAFKLAENQYRFLIKKIDTLSPLLQPRSLNKDGSLRMAYREDWTSGFFPGSLWCLFEFTKDKKWKTEAEKFTMALDSAQFVKWNHDVGFMIQNSFGNGYRLTKNETYKEAVIDAAKSLITRYRPVAKVIQSWDTDAPWIQGKKLDMPIIIDNMMNLNLLYKATKHTSDTTFANIANTHASTTIKNQYRKDYSCYHIIDYDHKTGKVRKKVNFQGYADESSWARGQAWGLYGYTEAYKESGKKEFLEQAKNIANFIMTNKKNPYDNIPYWDYDARSKEEIPRDASAAAIVASALLDLQSFDLEKKEHYLEYSETILRSLSSKEYLAEEKGNGGFVLKHSVGNFHENNENDAPLNYADYYYLESLLKWNKIQ